MTEFGAKINTNNKSNSSASSGSQYGGAIGSGTSSSTNPSDSGSYGSGSYGSGSYGSSGSSGSSSGEDEDEFNWEDADDLAEEAAKNLASVVGYNQQTLLNNADYANQVYDISDQQNAALRALENRQARRDANSDWRKEMQKQQSTTSALMNEMGNAKNGSALYSFWDALARVNDMADVEALDTLRQNLNTTDNNYWEAIMSTNNSRNEMYADTEQDLRELASDYVAQLNNLLTKNIMDLGEEGNEYAEEHSNFMDGLIDEENHTLNIPDWIQTSYFNDNKREAITPDEVALVRPANAASAARSLSGRTVANNSQSTNNNYWSRMRNDYNRRTQA